MKHHEAFKRDNAVVDYIASHKGKQNAVQAKDIADHLKKIGYPTSADMVRIVVRKVIRERCLPICCHSRDGFYWARTATEIQSTIEYLESVIASHQERVKILKQFLVQ